MDSPFYLAERHTVKFEILRMPFSGIADGIGKFRGLRDPEGDVGGRVLICVM